MPRRRISWSTGATKASLPFRPGGPLVAVVGHCRTALPLPESGDADDYRHENPRSEMEEHNDAGKQGDQRCEARAAAQESRAGRHRHEVGRDDKSRWNEQDVLGIAT